MLARWVALVVFSALLSWFAAPGAASARSQRAAPGPSPQPAPTSAQPTPDPAPQAIVKSPPTRSTPVSTTPERTSAVVRPVTRRLVSATPRSLGVPAPTPRPHASATQDRRLAARGHAPARRPRTHPSANRVSVSYLLSFLVTDLRRLTPGVLRDGAGSGRSGVLLLLSSLAMAVLAISSLALRQSLKRFGQEPR